jgi:probable phosphoglycerate mutase
VPQVVLVRHGETTWSRSGRHTGRTDVPLTPRGRAQARALGPRLADLALVDPLVLASPLRRALATARLAGLRPHPDERLVEWDYGGYEGLTTPEIRARRGDDWTIFRDGVPPGDGPDATPGESLEAVALRAAEVLADVAPVLEAGRDAVLVAHGHLLRVLATRWLHLPPEDGAHLVLSPGSLSRLGGEHDVPAILGWNEEPRD